MPTALLRDLRYAVRVCLRNRAFTLVATLTLGLAIGANTAAFSLIDALFLRPPPHVRAPEEIVIVASAGVEGSVSYSEYPDRGAGNAATYPPSSRLCTSSSGGWPRSTLPRA